MDQYFKHELKQIATSDAYELIVYLDDQTEEFSSELGDNPKGKREFLTSVKHLVKENYPKIRVTTVKVIIGGLAITSIPLMGDVTAVEAAEATSSPTSQMVQSNSIYYQVTSGDTLWGIANKFNTSVDNVRQANFLTSNRLTINQKLIIPQAFHTVGKGDYLSVLARQYGITVDAIKAANNMTSDVVYVGQILTIPKLISGQPTGDSTAEQVQSTYTVATGDSLWAIANRYQVTVSALKTINNLTSDTLRIGQKLTIPAGSTTPDNTDTTIPSTANIQYKVVAGDSLWAIAKRSEVSVDAIRSSNNLDTDNLSVGQILVIPKQESGVLAPVVTPAEGGTAATSHTVSAGDTLYSIANRYQITVDQLKVSNQLTNNTISVGQVLKIPNGSAAVNSESNQKVDTSLQTVQRSLQTLGYYAVPTMTGNYDAPTTTAIKNFQSDYGFGVTGKIDAATTTAIEHAVVKQSLIKDTRSYIGVPYLWGGTTPSGFDCSGFVYYMFNKHGVNMARNTSAGLYTQGKAISTANLQPGDLVFYSQNTNGSITHVGFYIGDNQWISATSSKGIAIYTMDNSYWAKYYVGAKRIY